MPAGIVPEGFHGKKGRSGRRSKTEEVEVIKQAVIKEATTEALVALAKTHLYKQLERGELSYQEIKELGLPIVLKDMVAKVGDPDGKPLQPILVEFINGQSKNNSDTGGVPKTV